MAPSTSAAEHKHLMGELRKNSVPELETVQGLFHFYFPGKVHLSSSLTHDELCALERSIEHQLVLPQKRSVAIREGLAKVHNGLYTIWPGFPERTVLDKMSLIARVYLLQFGYERRLAIIEPPRGGGGGGEGLIASIPYERHTMGDYRSQDVLWVWYDDRAASESVHPLFAGVCVPKQVPLHLHLHFRTDECAPSVLTNALKPLLDTTPSPARSRASLSFIEIPDTLSDAEQEDAPSDQDEDSGEEEEAEEGEDAITEPDAASTYSYDADIEDFSNSVFGTPSENDTLSSPRPMSLEPISHTPPPNAPTGPATVCWNCSGIGHRSSK